PPPEGTRSDGARVIAGCSCGCAGLRGRAGRARRHRGEVPAVIKLRNLEKAVKHGPGQIFLLRRIDLDVATGEFVTVMGPSGAGKSTLLAILGLLDHAWTGEYELFGERVDGLRANSARSWPSAPSA